MSIYAVERALYECSFNPANIGQLMEAPQEFLARYNLTDEEKQQIINQDVKALGEQGCSHMLLMMFWVGVNRGLDQMPEYLRRLNA